MFTKKDAINIALLLVITIAFFWQVLLTPKDLVTCGDLLSDSVYSSNFMHKTYQDNGERALWNPYFLMGKTHVAHIEYGQYYFTSLIFLFSYKDYFLNLALIIHFFLAGLFMYIFLRSIGVKRTGATVGAITFMLGRNFLDLFIGDILPVIAYSYIPLVFMGLEKVIEKRNLKWTTIFAAITSILFFVGRVQYFYYVILGLIVYATIRLIRKKDFKSIKYLAAAAIIFLGIVSIQLLPMLEIAPHTIQSGDDSITSYKFSSQESVPPKHFLTLLMPEFFGNRLDKSYWGAPSWLIDMYLGILSLLLALLAIIFVKDERKVPMTVLAGFSMLFALGSYTPFYKLLYTLIPGISLFKVPGRYLIIFTFSMASLTALGTDWLIMADREKIKKILKVIGLFALISAIGATTLLLLKAHIINYGERLLDFYYHTKYANTQLVKSYSLEYFQQKIPLAFKYILNSTAKMAAILATIVAALTLMLKTRKRSIAGAILVAIVIADLLIITNPYDWNEIKKASYFDMNSEKILDQWDSLANEIKGTEQFRVYGFPQEIIAQNNLQSLVGSDSMPIYYSSRYSQQVKKPFAKESYNLLKLANVKYLLTPETLDSNLYLPYKENLTYSHCRFGQNKKFNLYEVKDALPRAFIVPKSMKVELEEQFELIKNDSFDPKKEVLVTEDIGKEGGQQYKEANITYYSPNKVTISVETEKPGFLVMSDTYYVGWKAYDNGQEIKIYHANYIMRALYLPAGNHNIEFRYDPMSYKIGKWITLTTLSLIGLITILLIVFRKST